MLSTTTVFSQYQYKLIQKSVKVYKKMKLYKTIEDTVSLTFYRIINVCSSN